MKPEFEWLIACLKKSGITPEDAGTGIAYAGICKMPMRRKKAPDIGSETNFEPIDSNGAHTSPLPTMSRAEKQRYIRKARQISLKP